MNDQLVRDHELIEGVSEPYVDVEGPSETDGNPSCEGRLHSRTGA